MLRILIRSFLIGLFAQMLFTSAFAQPGCKPPDPEGLEPCREKRLNWVIKDFQMDSVLSVRSSFISDPFTKPSDCRKRFRATKQQAQKYFETTWIISNHAFHIVYESSCVFHGTLQTKSGKKYNWIFGEMGEGKIWRTDISDLRYLYCPECVDSLVAPFDLPKKSNKKSK